MIVATEYLTEWFASYTPSINCIPIVFIYDCVSLFADDIDTFDYQNKLSIGTRVGAKLPLRKGYLTCYLKETSTNEIFALTTAHIAFEHYDNSELKMCDQLIHLENSEDLELNEHEIERRSIGTLYKYW